MAEVPASCTHSGAIPCLLITIFPTTAPITQRSYERDLTVPTTHATEQSGSVWVLLPLSSPGQRRKPYPVSDFTSLPCRSTAPETAPRRSSTAFLYSHPDWTGLFPAPALQDSPCLTSWSNNDQESGSTWFKYSRKRARKEEQVHLRLIEETSFKGSVFQREAAVTAPAPHIGLTAQFYVFFFSSSNLRERSSKSMSSEAEELAPADAAGSVSGTDGNSGSTKLSTVLGAPAFGLGEASDLGPGPVTREVSFHLTITTLSPGQRAT